MDVLLASPPTASFHTATAVRLGGGPPRSSGGYVEMENSQVSVLAIDLPPGDSTVAVLFCPQWESGLACETVGSAEVVPLDMWKAT